jgi:prophage DNA circulation protein
MSKSSARTNSVSLTKVFQQISAEMNFIAKAVSVVEATVCNIMAANKTTDESIIHDLQNIDAISQSLLALANFSQKLSNSVSTNWLVDTTIATRDVSLADLAKRLKCQQSVSSADSLKTSGEWEAFD